MCSASIITIDGPAASGKTTIGKYLADKLHYLFFDTGIMYRAVTWAVLKQGIDVGQEDIAVKTAQTIEIDVRPATISDGRTSDILVDGSDITWEIRSPDVDKNVSQISAYQGVREALTSQQRRIGLRGSVVMVGRDIGTVVLPEAEIKIYLDATAEQRAKRRYQESILRGESSTYQEILQSMQRRDEIDSTREIAPLKPAPDAHVIHTDNKTIGQVLDEVNQILDEHSEGMK